MSWTFAEGSPLRAPSPHTPPRTVFTAVCDELGRWFAPDGLRYVRSRPRLEQRRGDLTLVMALWSARSGTAGGPVTLEVVSHVRSAALRRWTAATGIGRGDAVFTVDTRDPATGRYRKRFDVAGVTPASFADLAATVRAVCWEPMAGIAADGTVPADRHPRLEPVVDNHACWLWARGRRDEALRTAGLPDDLRARLTALG